MSDKHGFNSETLPFSRAKQEALLGHLLADPKTFQRVRAAGLAQNWWNSATVGSIWKMAEEFTDRHGRPPNPHELTDVSALPGNEAKQYQAIVTGCLASRALYGLDALERDLMDWRQAQLLSTKLQQSASLYNKQDLAGCASRLQECLSEMSTLRQSKEMTVSDLMAMSVPTQTTLVGPLKTEQLVYLYGAANSAKTWTWLMLAAEAVKNGVKALWITEEDTLSEIQRRLRATHLDTAGDKLAIRHKTRLDLSDAQQVQGLIHAIKQGGYQLVCLDPLSNMCPFDDADQEKMRLIDRTLQQLRDETRACIVILHHGTKASFSRNRNVAASPSVPDMNNMRGSSVLQGSADLMLEVRKDYCLPGVSLLHMVKNRAGCFWPGPSTLTLTGSGPALTVQLQWPELAAQYLETAKAEKKSEESTQLRDEILEYLRVHPGAKQQEIYGALKRKNRVLEELEKLTRTNLVSVTVGERNARIYSLPRA